MRFQIVKIALLLCLTASIAALALPRSTSFANASVTVDGGTSVDPDGGNL